MKEVQDSSHTPQGAFGYLLSQIHPSPKLTVATRFPVADDTVACALNSVRQHCSWVTMDPPGQGNFVFSFDLMVIKVFAGVAGGRPQQFRALVNNYGFSPVAQVPPNLKTAKYHNPDKSDAPLKQLDLETWVQATNKITHDCNYRDDGY